MRLLPISIFLFSFVFYSSAYSQEAGYKYTRPELAICIKTNNVEFKDSLARELKSNLASRYSLVFVDECLLEKKCVKVTEMKIKHEVNASNQHVWQVEAKVHVSGADEISNPHFSISETSNKYNNDNSYAEIVTKTVEQIAKICRFALPVKANVIDLDNDIVYLDRGQKSGIEPGTYCDILDFNGEKTAVIKIDKIAEDHATGKIVKGKSSVNIGYTAETRQFIDKYGFVLEYMRIPVDVKEGSVYEAQTGDEISKIDHAQALMLSTMWQYSLQGNRIKFGGGLLSLGDMKTWIFDVSASQAHFLLFDRMSVFLEAGGGVFKIPAQKYARPAGDYDDDFNDQGTSNNNYQWYFRAEPGISLFFNEMYSISLFGGYFYTGDGSDWSIGKERVELNSEWVKYDSFKVSGFHFGVMFSIFGTGYEK
ncbi:MAG: hypothetical protein JW814_06685 [Candidatus Krumholzibacteriota bacterium]|nr:hypothetical protein [Candidatus Krumholzibacteriota bacterium]